MGEANTLKIVGDENVKIYRAKLKKVEEGKEIEILSPHCRHFCKECGTHLWASDHRWKDWIYPFTNCMDTPLPTVPFEEQVHLMCEFKASWLTIPSEVKPENKYQGYPSESIEAWHKKRGRYGTWKPE
eukprot:TRINITY_DN5290_c0_g1_i2.p1 TRINITY_DN5290_c0_g1~~TRINITY_DN5290_c0_g1_i2.p1  ORF type:complete len:128 (-),score=15.01 TRINITY_DN5290_c0_g1_i2:47-430(-)